MSAVQSVVYALDSATGLAVPVGALVDPVSLQPYIKAAMFALSPTVEQIELVSARQGTFGAMSGNGALLVAEPGEWAASAVPPAATRATVTLAGAVGTRHVCRSITACLANDAAAQTGPCFVYLRDGASGVGAILWAGVLRGGAYANGQISLSGLNIVGTAGNDMTLEFDVAPDAGHNQTVAMTGYSAT